jgi:hypothetical protein
MINEKTEQQIAEALEAGLIYNVDWKDLKESINRQLEKGYKAVTSVPYLALPPVETGRGDRGVHWDIVDALYYGTGPQIHANMQSKIAKLEKKHADHWMVQAARKYADAVLPIIADANKIKSTITKSRKPRDTESLTPERTIENTGTCAVCGMNVKRSKGGNIVAHGFTRRWGFQSGNCSGVGYPPIEISPEGAVSYLVVLRSTLEQAEATVERIKPIEYAERTKADRSDLARAEAAVRYAPADIKRFETTIEKWEATDLPDSK